MIRKFIAVTGLSALIALPLAHAAEFDKAVEARQAYMDVLAFNVGILTAMSRGQAEYNAAEASAAAGNLMHAGAMNLSAMWPAGSDMSAYPDSVAKASLWQNFGQVETLLGDLASTTQTLAGEAGNGLTAMQAALKPVTDTCSSCHREFRARR